MHRKKKLLLNTGTSLLYQIITLGCGFLIPKLILSAYGSATNGLVSSITQFLSFISLAECGVGAVVRSSLYKPLAEQNMTQVSRVLKSSERFFRKIAVILLIYSAGLSLFYPFVVRDKFEYLFTLSLILIMTIGTFAQYYFSITYRQLLDADQMSFVVLSVQSITLVLNTVACLITVHLGAPIHIFKLSTSLLFLLQPLIFTLYVRRHYRIDKNIRLTEEPIKQKWNGLAQHIATVVLNNTDVVILTFFSTLENVSVYAVYHTVVGGLKQIMTSLTTGMQALFGNMYARDEKETLNKTFDAFEWGMHTLTTLLFGMACILIVPFVRVYTKGITDADYIVPVFGLLITIAQAAYSIQMPYSMMVRAAGHYKETQASAIIEAAINVFLSLLLVQWLGLIGVAIGTFIAMLYRAFYLAFYLSKHILQRPMRHFLIHLLIDAGTIVLMLGTSYMFDLQSVTYVGWMSLALKVGGICLVENILINLLFYRGQIRYALSFVKFKKS